MEDVPDRLLPLYFLNLLSTKLFASLGGGPNETNYSFYFECETDHLFV